MRLHFTLSAFFDWKPHAWSTAHCIVWHCTALRNAPHMVPHCTTMQFIFHCNAIHLMQYSAVFGDWCFWWEISCQSDMYLHLYLYCICICAVQRWMFGDWWLWWENSGQSDTLYLSSQNLFQFTPLQEYYHHNFHNNFLSNPNHNVIKIANEMNDILFSFMVSDPHKIENVWKYCWEDWITLRTADSCCFIYSEHIFLDKFEHIYLQSFFNMHTSLFGQQTCYCISLY